MRLFNCIQLRIIFTILKIDVSRCKKKQKENDLVENERDETEY